MFGVKQITDDNKHAHLKGNLVLMFENDCNSVNGGLPEIIGGGVTCQLISSTVVDKNNGNRGMVGVEATLDLEQQLLNSTPLMASSDHRLYVTFDDWDVSEHGIPGAIIVKNKGAQPFYLKNITISGVPGCGTVVFLANSWVYPQSKYPYDRVFFANHTYLPSQMPAPLKPYRDDELRNLRGDDQDGPYEEHHRVYRYDVYNDLGNPDGGQELARPTLGGSKHHPYPRRGRTGRKPMDTDPGCESWVKGPFFLDSVIYVPCDERFGDFKWNEFKLRNILSLVHRIKPQLEDWCNGGGSGEFDSLEDIIDSLYRQPQKAGTKQQQQVNPAVEEMRKRLSSPQLRKDDDDLLPVNPTTRDHFGWLWYPKPQIIQEDEKAWMSDDEFAREMLAGVNPVMIKRLTEFPPKSTLDPSKYGDQTSTITEAHIKSYLEGLTVQQALESNRLYILDHHDHYMPFLTDVNKIVGNFVYATRTLLFLRRKARNGTLTPVAIELSLPELRSNGIIAGAKSTVYTPTPTPTPTSAADAWVWQLAKAYVNVNDYCWHQGISHWLNTHAVMEPFVIATNRQLSVTHPVHKLLLPHYRDTMKINALARQNLVQADGIFEETTFAGRYAFEISSKVYGSSWNFTEQALPNDLIKRGMAVEDESSPYKVRLLVEDYPYASDGLAIWNAIEQWVAEYLAIYYPNDDVVKSDVELQEWWKEVREVGHGDLKDEPWWPKMQTVAELTRTCSTIIWIASALHAAVNFGQYPYCRYYPNRPSMSRRPIPDQKLDPEGYEKLQANPELFFVQSITRLPQALLGISLLEVLSSQSPKEVYLGQRDTPEWTSDAKAQEAFKRFGECLNKIEKDLEAKNNNTQLHNRRGPAKFPYTLLFPNTSGKENDGITARGIPNSVSI